MPWNTKLANAVELVTATQERCLTWCANDDEECQRCECCSGIERLMQYLGVEQERYERDQDGDSNLHENMSLAVPFYWSNSEALNNLHCPAAPKANTIALFRKACNSISRLSANFSANFFSQAKNLRTLIFWNTSVVSVNLASAALST